MAEMTMDLTSEELEMATERLRKSKQSLGLAQVWDGAQKGREWAKGHAEFSQLALLDGEFGEDGDSDPEDISTLDRRDHRSWSDAIVSLISPEIADDDHAIREFWETWGPTGLMTDVYLEGFVKGALEVWDQIKDNI